MSQYTSYWLYQKYEKRGDQDWIPVYPNVYSVDGEGSLTAVTKTDNDPACGYVPTGETIYRWVNLNPNVDYYCDECPPDPGTRIYRWAKTTNTTCVEDEPTPIEPQYRTITTATTCVGYDLHVLEEHQVSNDGGVTWTTTGTTTGSLIEADSRDCGYVPPPKWVATFAVGTTASAECDSSSAITRYEVDSDVASIEIGDCVTSIGDYALYECRSLSSVTIPNSVTSFGTSAFGYCSGLTSIIIPDSVTSIGDSAFQDCSGLTSVIIPDSVTSIGMSAFWDCRSLTSVTISSGVTSINYGVFVNCISLSSVTIPDSVTSIGSHAFYNCIRLSNVTIPSSVTSIGSYAFSECNSLSSVTIPDSVTSIEEGTFKHSHGLSSVTIPNSVTSIGRDAFMYCTGLSSITIPSGVTFIGDNAFMDCVSLSSVTINATTPPTIGGYVTFGPNDCPIYVPCSSVSAYKSASGWSIYASRIHGIPPCEEPTVDTKWVATFTGGTTASAECDSSSAITNGEVSRDVVSIEIGDCVTSIEGYAFYECRSLTSVTIPNSVTYIGGYYNFYDCVSLTSVTIPNSVTSIGPSAFKDCYGLTSVTIGNGVTSIGDTAFVYCGSLTSITVKATTPPALGSGVFNYTNDCPIYVPSESVQAYKTANRWNTYASRIQAIP